jgi:hypothetical protein
LDLSTPQGKGTYNPPLEARQSRQWHRAHVAGYEDLGKEMVMAAQLQLPWMVSSVAIGNIFIYFLLCLVAGSLDIDVMRLLYPSVTSTELCRWGKREIK